VIVKVCRDCGEEYRPEILRCADCGGELEARMEEEHGAWPVPTRRAEPREVDTRPPGDYRPIQWNAYAAALTPLADRLMAAEIPFYLRPRVVEGGAVGGYEIRVRQEERELALRELEALHREASPDSGGDALAAPATQAGPAGRTGCPACGATLSESAVECPDCGLALAGDVEEE
jgi:hypothetical protein